MSQETRSVCTNMNIKTLAMLVRRPYENLAIILRPINYIALQGEQCRKIHQKQQIRLKVDLIVFKYWKSIDLITDYWVKVNATQIDRERERERRTIARA